MGQVGGPPVDGKGVRDVLTSLDASPMPFTMNVLASLALRAEASTLETPTTSARATRLHTGGVTVPPAASKAETKTNADAKATADEARVAADAAVIETRALIASAESDADTAQARSTKALADLRIADEPALPLVGRHPATCCILSSS